MRYPVEKYLNLLIIIANTNVVWWKARLEELGDDESLHVTKPLIYCLIRALWRFGVVTVTYFCF
jgi:hypothetical protein